MNPLTRILPVAPQRIERAPGSTMTRRSMIAGTAVSSFVLGHVSDVLTDPWMEPVRDAWRDVARPGLAVTPPVSTRVMDVDRAVDREGGNEMRAALALHCDGRAHDLPAWVMRRATATYLRDGERWQGAQGDDIRLWPGYDRADIPMRAQPDPLLAEDACRRLDRCCRDRAPMFWRCVAWVRDERQPDMPPWERRWVALTLPVGDEGGAVSITAKL